MQLKFQYCFTYRIYVIKTIFLTLISEMFVNKYIFNFQAAFNISCAAKVKGTHYEYYAQDDFRVRKPDIKFTFQGKIVSQQPVDVIVRLTNPLPIPLKKGMFYIEGPGIEKALRFKVRNKLTIVCNIKNS